MKIKKIATVTIGMLLSFSIAFQCVAATAKQKDEKSENQNSQTQQETVTVKAKSAILVEESTGKILYEKNPHEKLNPASITKVMTELLVLEAIEQGRISFEDKVTCSKHASSMGGSDIWLKEGEVMTVQELFKAMAVSSANDAAVALAERVSGSELAFVKQMNLKAKKMGMNDTNFVNCTGLDADGHVTSAYDVMLMSKELMKHRKIFDYCTIWMDSLRNGKTTLYNTNKLIRFYSGANGLKTGSTGKAGYCLSASATRDNMFLNAVVLGSDNSSDRFDAATNLLDYGFANWSLVTPKLEAGGNKVKVLHGEHDTVTAVTDAKPSVLVEKGKEKEIRQKVSLVDNVMAPVDKGQMLGQITLMVDGKTVGTIPLKAEQAVSRMTFFKAFARIFTVMVTG